MLHIYFTQITTVKLAAKLLDRELYDNYAFHGALPRYLQLELGDIIEAEGIEDMPKKAESFRFGLLCGEVLQKYLSEYNEEELLLCDALVAREVFMDINPEKVSKYTQEQLKNNVSLIFKALFKRTQIRTHTAKPGSEDINAWIAGYYAYQKDYDDTVAAMTDAILFPNPTVDEKAFFNPDDAIIALALRNSDPSEEGVSAVLENEPISVFGKILREIVTKVGRT